MGGDGTKFIETENGTSQVSRNVEAIIDRAAAHALKFPDDTIGSLDLLRALIEQHGALANQALINVGVSFERLRLEIDVLRPARPAIEQASSPAQEQPDWLEAATGLPRGPSKIFLTLMGSRVDGPRKKLAGASELKPEDLVEVEEPSYGRIPVTRDAKHWSVTTKEDPDAPGEVIATVTNLCPLAFPPATKRCVASHVGFGFRTESGDTPILYVVRLPGALSFEGPGARATLRAGDVAFEGM